MKNEKPILFTTENVKGILEDRKIQTRRIINFKPVERSIYKQIKRLDDKVRYDFPKNKGTDLSKLELKITKSNTKYAHFQIKYKSGNTMGDWFYEPTQLYKKGMILWVRETWQYGNRLYIYRPPNYVYKANDIAPITPIGGFGEYIPLKWKPSIFMPRAASRITLEITDVRAERLQKITYKDILKEGLIEPIRYTDEIFMNKNMVKKWIDLWDSINAKPKPKFKNKIITHYESYPWSVETSDKRTEINGKPHYCHPNAWVWCISFRRIK